MNNPNDIYLQKFTAQNTFEESPLSVEPNAVIVSDINKNLTMVNTASFIKPSTSASYALTASFALNGGASLTSGSTYNITSSYVQTASWSNNSLTSSYLNMNDSGWIHIGTEVGEDTLNMVGAVQIGFLAGQHSVDSNYTVQVGIDAGRYAISASSGVFVGSSAGYNATYGYNCTFIGAGADVIDSSTDCHESIAIGYNAIVSGSNQCVIGGTGVDAVNVSIGGNSAVNTLDVVGNISCSVITASLFSGDNVDCTTVTASAMSVITGSGAPIQTTQSPNLGNAAAWMPVQFNGQTYYIPLYQ